MKKMKKWKVKLPDICSLRGLIIVASMLKYWVKASIFFLAMQSRSAKFYCLSLSVVCRRKGYLQNLNTLWSWNVTRQIYIHFISNNVDNHPPKKQKAKAKTKHTHLLQSSKNQMTLYPWYNVSLNHPCGIFFWKLDFSYKLPKGNLPWKANNLIVWLWKCWSF